MLGRRRETWRRFEPVLASASVYMPSPRKDLMLLMRSKEDADGERRMIGSMRRPGFERLEMRAGFCGIEAGLRAPGRLPGCLLRLRPMNASAYLRMWEKSCLES